MTHDAVGTCAVREATHPPVEGGGCLEQTRRYGATIVDQARAKRAARMPVEMALSPGTFVRRSSGEMVLSRVRRDAKLRVSRLTSKLPKNFLHLLQLMRSARCLAVRQASCKPLKRWNRSNNFEIADQHQRVITHIFVIR